MSVISGLNNKIFLMQKHLNMIQVFFIIAYALTCSCKGIKQKEETPREFLNFTEISRQNYTDDSVKIIKQLMVLLAKRKDFFYNKAYFDSTELIIDSIIYNPDFCKLAAFVIVKNPTYRQLVPDTGSEWYYDATCYLGLRQKDTIELSWIGPVFTNSTDKQNVSNEIRQACFRTFATRDTSDAYSYNLNDIRFWNSPIWKKIEDERKREKDFENEKKKHPENVFAPNK
jgi:hypothetical protein